MHSHDLVQAFRHDSGLTVLKVPQQVTKVGDKLSHKTYMREIASRHVGNRLHSKRRDAKFGRFCSQWYLKVHPAAVKVP